MITRWPCPTPSGASSEEYAVACDGSRPHRLLIIPALFDEANRLRRFAVEAMRGLDAAGIDSILPDLPGTNESLATLATQSLATWRVAMAAAATHFGATHVLALRGGALVAPALPGWTLAPVSGASVLRQMIRTRILAAREASRDETSEALLAAGRNRGLVLAGHDLGVAMVRELEVAEPAAELTPITQSQLGGSALWLRAEPDEAPDQSAALVQIVARGLQS